MSTDRDRVTMKLDLLGRRMDDLSRSLESQIAITVQLRSEHNLTIHRLADALRTDEGPVTLATVLASIEPARPE